MSLQLIVRRDLALTEPLPFMIADYFKQLATYRNPEYVKAKQMVDGHRMRPYKLQEIPEWVTTWRIVEGEGQTYLVLPRGMQEAVETRLRHLHMEWELADFRTAVSAEPNHHPTPWLEPLWDYQQDAFDAMVQHSQGVLLAPTGSGKTNLGIAIMRYWNQPAIWLCHTKDLISQTTKRITELTGVPASDIGLIGGGKTIIKEWTVASMQSLNRKPPEWWKEYGNYFGVVIVDECHHLPANTFAEIIRKFSSRYVYGLTASEQRRDGLTQMIFDLIGPVRWRIPFEVVVDSGRVLVPRVQVVKSTIPIPMNRAHLKAIQKDGPTAPNPNDDYVDWNLIESTLLESDERNTLIVDTVLGDHPEQHSALVLTTRIDHAEELVRRFNARDPSLNACVLHGKLKDRERKAVIERIATGEVRVVVGTTLADEGLDVKLLDRMMLTMPTQNIRKLIQQPGRIMRANDGKGQPLLWDILDEHNAVLKGMFFKRLKFYRSRGMVPAKKPRTSRGESSDDMFSFEQ